MRWYINEICLLIDDMRKEGADRKALYESIRGAVNSYLTLMNRVITSIVGDKFEYISVNPKRAREKLTHFFANVICTLYYYKAACA